MALAFVGGAALGAVFGELLTAILDEKDKALGFTLNLNQLELTIRSVIPIIEEIKKLKRELDHPDEELKELIKHLEGGEKLVRKCSKVTKWKFYKRSSYSKKILELDARIQRFFNANVPVQSYRESLKILVGVNGMDAKLDRIMSGEGNSGYYNPVGNLGSCWVPDPPAFTVGLDVPLRELKMRLLKDDARVPVVVVSGPGGCGKTTLVQKLCQDEEVKGKFKNMFFITVSEKPNLMKIISELLHQKGCQVPEFRTDDCAKNYLEKELKQLGPNPVLLVLDDVWSGSESLLGKLVFEIPYYRILVTSRSVFPRFDYTYKLLQLNDADAMELFCCSAFPQNGSPYMPDEDLVNKIVRSCKGLPLALKVVGSSLYGQPIAIWKKRAIECSKGQSVLSSESYVLNRLKSSLDALNDNIVKECFMDLASFPEDQRISAAALVDMWIELYQLDEVVYAITYLHELATRNLINLVVTRKDEIEVESCYNDLYVTQHDLLRELAIHQSNQDPMEQRKRVIIDMTGNSLIKSSLELKQPLLNARLLSISTDEMSSNWCDVQVQLPETEVVILNFRTNFYTIPSFTQKMDKTKVLILSNYGLSPAELSNLPMLSLFSNLKRIRFERISIPALSQTIIRFNNLQKVSFVMCCIGQAFWNCNVSHMFPNLTEIDIDYCNDLKELSAGFCDLVHLKKLSITNCHNLFKLPEKIGSLRALEVLILHACSELSELPDSITTLQNLSYLDISDCLSLKRLPKFMGNLHDLRNFHMRGSALSQLPQSITKLEQLKVVFCDEETAVLWKSFKARHTNLKIKVLKENISLDGLHIFQF